jgi:hypothetical protein
MNSPKTIGFLLILGALGVFAPYTVLTLTFDYPGILRQESGEILTRFHQGGPALVLTWLAFAWLGAPLLIAYSLLGQRLEKQLPAVRWLTTLGIIAGVAQIIGLLRWVFVVPVLAAGFVQSPDPVTREAIRITFTAIHQFGGVLLGEHLGQLFTIAWTVGISAALYLSGYIPRWLAGFGFGASGIYLLAQAELLQTVIPGFPVVGFAGFAGSTLWLIWLILVGLRFIRQRVNTRTEHLIRR